MAKSPKQADTVEEVTKTVDGVEFYEPHNQNKAEYKASDVAYGRKRPCMLADGTYPETVAETE